MKIGILGGGFGLYGYLPAAVKNGLNVQTLSKYKDTVKSRNDISYLLKDIDFIDSELELIQSSQKIVIARDPYNQYKLLTSTNDFSGKILYLEKPLAHTKKLHYDILDALHRNETLFKINYIFLYTLWYSNISTLYKVNSNLKININWVVKKSSSSWKWDINSGGGIAKFYGIHFIPIMYYFGISKKDVFCINKSSNELSIIANHLNIKVSVGEISFFEVQVIREGKVVYSWNGINPFSENVISPYLPDPRIELLVTHLESDIDQFSILTSIAIEEFVVQVLYENLQADKVHPLG